MIKIVELLKFAIKLRNQQNYPNYDNYPPLISWLGHSSAGDRWIGKRKCVVKSSQSPSKHWKCYYIVSYMLFVVVNVLTR